MKKLTSFAIGIIIIWPLLKAITWFIDNVLESALGRGLASDYTSVGLIILLPVIFYFLMGKSMNFKQKMVRSLSLGGGILFLFLIFFIGFVICLEQKDCISTYNLIIYAVEGVAAIYLIFRFVKHMKTKNSK